MSYPFSLAMRQIVADSFAAGSDTISTFLKWHVFLMVQKPEVTEKLRKHIDANVPRDRLVSLDDKPK